MRWEAKSFFSSAFLGVVVRGLSCCLEEQCWVSCQRCPLFNTGAGHNSLACFARTQEDARISTLLFIYFFFFFQAFAFLVHSTSFLSKSFSRLLFALGTANSDSHVGPQNEIGHPARRHKWLKQVPALGTRGIQIGFETYFSTTGWFITRYLV